MSTALYWIIASSLVMSLISLVGALTLVLPEKTLKKLLLPLVAMAAGTLISGAFFHLLPAAVERFDNHLAVYLWLLAGFLLFFALEQFLHWHHCHKTISEHRRPFTYMILISDTVHNFIGGLAVAGSFLIDIRLGISAWLAAAAHEIPQELGDFSILLHGGWKSGEALFYNFLSALTFLLGGLAAYFLAAKLDVSFLLPLAAGNFIYIATVDLVPEINKHEKIKTNLIHFFSFAFGILLLLLVRLLFDHH